MGFFSKRKNENIGFTVNADDDGIKISGDKNMAPHAITADELSSLWVLGDDSASDYSNSEHSALDSLKKRMKSSVSESPTPSKTELQSSALSTENVKKDGTKHEEIKKEEKSEEKTLLEKLHRYTVDEQGHDLSKENEPLYKLESVAEILKSNSENSIKNLSKKYDFFIDDLGKNKPEPPETDKEKSESKQKAVTYDTQPTSAFKKMVTDAEKREEETLYENLFKDAQDETPKEPVIDIPNISDIDNREFGTTAEKPIADTATIRFTPIKDNKGNTDHITVSSITRQLDLEGVISEPQNTAKINTELEESEFEKFEPREEMTDVASGKKLLRKLALKKRSAFLRLIMSIFAVIALLFFLLPPIADFIISNPKTSMIICTAFLSVSVLANCNMFSAFAKLLKKRSSADVLASASSVFTLALSLSAIITSENAYYIILLCAITLVFRSLASFKSASAIHGNLKQTANEKEINAVTLIDDTATTFAMAKNSIEGDVLVCGHKKTEFVKDFMKHSAFSASLSGKVSLIFYLSTTLAFLSGIISYFYYGNLFDAFYCATAISLLASLPTLFFIDSFPLSSAAKKLNSKGAMIAGLHGAEVIESANAVAVSVKDIFPEGTVKMYSMKVLSDNSIDQTILKAASLTAALNSPLESIFNQIAGTNTAYSIPDSDTVKYEKRLGISGWVDNELLFIGNRSLMEAHGIPIPSVEIDKKILRRGYFPVYVATENTACALIVIQYDVREDIAKELRKITDLGITLLVDNCDPNINEEMICDYFGLYEDSVKIMTNSGVYMYKNATPFTEKCSAPALYCGSAINFIKIINCASNIKLSNKILTVMYAVFAILGIVYFVYASFSGLQALPQQLSILAYALITTFLSIIGFLIRKP